MEKERALGVLAALAQETRLDVFRRLVEAGSEGLAAGRIGEELRVPAATLSFHLKELRHAGVVRCQKQGRLAIYAADFDTMNQLVGYLLENCCGRSSRSPRRAHPAARGS